MLSVNYAVSFMQCHLFSVIYVKCQLCWVVLCWMPLFWVSWRHGKYSYYSRRCHFHDALGKRLGFKWESANFPSTKYICRRLYWETIEVKNYRQPWTETKCKTTTMVPTLWFWWQDPYWPFWKENWVKLDDVSVIKKDCFQVKSKFITDHWCTTHKNITILN